MSTVASPTSSTAATAASASSSSAGKAGGTDSSDRFLKLLVTQMQNQDPLNPMDNAQVTSQMAQINTVTGIEKLNTTVQGLNTQLGQMQVLQGASLVGRDVTVAGDRLSSGSNGLQGAGFELAGAADAVQVELLDAGGRVVQTLQLGAQSAGRQRFEVPEGGASGAERFRVSATSGAAEVQATALMRDRVESASVSAGSLQLQLQRAGSVAWSDVKTFD